MTDQMITYNDLIKPVANGGYAMSRLTVHRLLEMARETDGCLLYRNHMLDSSEAGRTALVVYGPGRSISEVDAAPKRIGDVPFRFKQLEGVVDLDSLRKGEDGYEPPSLNKAIRAVGDPELGSTLWSIYGANADDLTASAYTDDARKRFKTLKQQGWIKYRRTSPQGWSLVAKAWEALEE